MQRPKPNHRPLLQNPNPSIGVYSRADGIHVLAPIQRRVRFEEAY